VARTIGVSVIKSSRIPKGWEFVSIDHGWEAAWSTAMRFKHERERLRPDLFVRVKVVPSGSTNVWWILKKEESR
jgi:hypothetical protein